MIKTEYFCDFMGEKNKENEEFPYQIILVGEKLAQRKFKVCADCLEKITQFILKANGT